MNLKQRAITGIKWTSLSTLLIAVVQLAQVAVLARFLAPADFGLMAMMMVVIGFSQVFMDMGISNAIIHRQNLTHVQLSSLYWLNLASGLGLFCVVIFAAPLVAQFYGEPRITPYMRALAWVFVLVSIGNQYRILCQKEMQFDRMAKIDISAACCSFAVAVVLAVLDFGVYALIVAMLTQAGVSSLLYLLIGLRFHHRPALLYRHAQLRGFYSFGLFQMGEKSINFFNTEFDVLIIGKLLGAEATGVYHIAKTLTMKVIGVINPVATKVTLPYMAKLQYDLPALRQTYLLSLRYLALVSYPIYVTMIVLAEPLVLTLFGEQWRASIPVLQILAVYTLLRSTANPIGTLVMARGRADLSFFWNLALFFIVPTVVAVGTLKGLTGVATALAGLMLVLKLPEWYFLVRPLSGARFSEFAAAILRPLVLVVAGALVGSLCLLLEHRLLAGGAFLLASGLVYGLMLRRFEKEFVGHGAEFLPARLRSRLSGRA